MRVLVLGGSNSRMKAGYVPTLAAAMPEAEIDNRSIGANTCVMAFQALSEVKQRPDVVVIEYSVNDYALTVSGKTALWEAAFEGLVRTVMRRWPRARVIPLILGRQDASEARWADQVSRTRRIARHYGARTFNAAGWLRRQAIASFADTLHHSPDAANLIGRHLATVIRRMKPRSHRLPRLLSAAALYPIQVVDLRDYGHRRRFNNSGIDMEAGALVEPIEIVLPGSLVAISIVSSADAGGFEIECEGRRAVVQTLHRQVESGDFAFLPLTAVSDWWADQPKERIIRLKPTARADDHWPIYHVGPNPAAYRAYLVSALVKAAYPPKKSVQLAC